MTIKDIPHVTCEQILALREAAIKLEEQSHQLKTRLLAMQECAIKCHDYDWQSNFEYSEEMLELMEKCHADHSDVLGENK